MGDPQAGQGAAVVCSACHGQEGKSILPSYPNLGGQHYSYLLKQMRYFKSGDRYAALMAGQVDALPDDTLRNIAAFYAAKPMQEGVAEGADLDLGERIYRAGLADKGVPACLACHSPRGLGNGPAAFPTLSGQNAEYVDVQLKAYRSGERQTDESLGGMMRGVARNLNDEEIAAVSAYVQGLH
ncbi:MAG: c-type cytochrome [Pseudomonadales bacterium]|nr:c-type cytochrome [Pseudomonadales bacterium]